MEITKALVIEDDGHGSTTSPAMVVFSIQPEPTTPSSASLSSSPRTLGYRDYLRRRPLQACEEGAPQLEDGGCQAPAIEDVGDTAPAAAIQRRANDS
jgi:hypothetical protein